MAKKRKQRKMSLETRVARLEHLIKALGLLFALVLFLVFYATNII